VEQEEKQKISVDLRSCDRVLRILYATLLYTHRVSRMNQSIDSVVD
jgi:hypothetical protein